MRVAAKTVLVATVTALAGCGSAASSPRATLDALVSATRAADPAGALYELLPASARRAETLTAFRARVGADRRSLAELREAVGAALAAGAPVAAELREGPRRVLAVEEREGWRVGGPALGDASVVATPGREGARAALAHLRRALERRDLAGLVAMLSGRARGAMESDLRDLATSLEDLDALQFPDVPGATRVRLPDGRVLMLVWERDGWRVEGLVERPTP
jgi:hypothetical protein